LIVYDKNMSLGKVVLAIIGILLIFAIAGFWLALLAIVVVVIFLRNKNQNFEKNDAPPAVTVATTEESIFSTFPENEMTHFPISNDEKADFDLLLRIYRENKDNDNVDVLSLVKQVNPEATPHKCPYCEIIHEFKASRARKCPNCSEKMVVRQGLFVTERQAGKIEELVQKFYETQGGLTRVGYSLEGAQDSMVRKEKVDYLRKMAEGFRYLAPQFDQKNKGGYSFWDRAWSYYNKARMEEMKTLSKDMIEYNQLPNLSWDMSQMLLEQANSQDKPEKIKRDKSKALNHSLVTISEIAKFHTDPYYIVDIYEFSKKLMIELEHSNDEFLQLATKNAERMGLAGKDRNKYDSFVKGILDYQIIR